MSTNILPDKAVVHRRCLEIVLEKKAALETQLAELAESAANETKSTAGDKYETARAMLHIEQDQVRRQLHQLQTQLAALQAIDTAAHRERITPGSLVNLDGSWYYLSTGLGKIACGGTMVIALSPEAPLGAGLRGLAVGATVAQNGKRLQVLEIR